MLPKTLPRPYYVGVSLRPEEYAAIITDVRDLGISKAEALRRRSREPGFFDPEPVRCGRIPGVSPQKRTDG